MKTYNVKTIDLNKYYLAIIITISISIILTLIATYIFSNIIKFNYLLFIGLILVIGFTLMNLSKKYFYKSLSISINSSKIKFKEVKEQTILIDEIKSVKFKTRMNNFPKLIIDLKKGETLSYRSKDKISELDDFVLDLQKIIK